MSARASLSFVTAAHAADLKRERDDAREKLRALVEAADGIHNECARAGQDRCSGRATADCGKCNQCRFSRALAAARGAL